MIRQKLVTFFMPAVCILTGLAVIFPVIYCLGVSFMSPDQLSTYPPKLFPNEFYWENYKIVFTSTPILRFMWNSFFIAFVCTVGRLITSSLAAYSFVFFDYKGKHFWFLFILGTMMIPGDMLIITNYITVAKLDLIDTYAGVMVVMLASAVYMFVLRQHFLTIPKEFKDAAFVDGCGHLRFYLSVVLPVSRPILSSIFIASFINLWNTYLWPLMVTNAEEMRTVQVGITMLQFEESMVYGPVMAGVIVILIPSIFVFLVFQKQLVFSITSSGIKG